MGPQRRCDMADQSSPGPPSALQRVWSAAVSWHLLVKRRLMRVPGHARRSTDRFLGQLAKARAERDVSSVLFRLLGYRLWWRLHRPFQITRSDLTGLVVIGGSPRSGTTLLRTMLGRHPDIFAGPETTLFLHRISSPRDIGERLAWDPDEIERWQRESYSQTQFIERCATALRARHGRAVWAEKTPHNVMRFGFVRRCFPHAKLVHIIRDGRDVVCSLRQQPFSKVDGAAADSAGIARLCALQWRRCVQSGLRFRGQAAYYELRYEDLVHDAEPTLRALLSFLGLSWNEALLQTGIQESAPDLFEPKAVGQLFESSIGRWREDLTGQELDVVNLLAGELLAKLGYA